MALVKSLEKSYALPKAGGKDKRLATSIDMSDVKVPNTPGIIFLCFNLDHYTQLMQFIILSSGIFFFYLMYGFFQELIFRLEGMRTYGWFLTLIQFALYSIFSFFELQIRREGERRIPLSTYFLLAFFTVATMGLSNTSVGYLNYPTQVMFKCCKLIPVLIGSILIQGKKYGPLDFIAAICMSAGLTLFTLADSKVSPNFDIVGVIMISLALVADAVIGNIQEKSMKQYQASNTEVILYSYFIGFIYLLVGALLSGGLFSALKFCAKYPMETYGYSTVFSATGYLGIQLVLSLIKSSGVFVTVTVTTFRKALSIILSFLLFTKPFHHQYIWAGLLVVLGIYLNAYSKIKHHFNLAIVIQQFKNLANFFLSFPSKGKQTSFQV